MKKLMITTGLLLGILCFAMAQSPKKYILLEEFSTAPCGFCPDGDIVAHNLVTAHPEVIWVTHHAGFGTDSMTINESKTIASTFTTFAPGACIDRIDAPIPVYTKPPYIAISRQKWDSVTSAHLNDTVKAELQITNSYDTITRLLDATINVHFLYAPLQGDLRLNLFIVEDSVVGYGPGYDQKSYFNKQVGHPLYGKGDTIVGYVHHRVVRAIPSTTWGLSGIIPNAPAQGSSYAYTFTDIQIPAKWKNKDIDVIAFVSYYNSDAKKRTVINSAHKMLLDNSTSAIQSPGLPENMFTIYPIPSNGLLHLKSTGTSLPYQISIYSADGSLVRQENLITENAEIQLHELEGGLYFYRITNDIQFMQRGKFVLQK